MDITKLEDNSPDSSPENINEENRQCRFCQQSDEEGVRILSLTNLLLYLPVYVSPSDPEYLSRFVCYACVGKMHFVKNFFTQIYDSYVDVTENVSKFLKHDMIVESEKLVKLEVNINDAKNETEETDSKVTFAEDSKTPNDEEKKHKIESKPLKRKKRYKVPKHVLESGKLLPLKYRGFRQLLISSLATLCTCAECGKQFEKHEENVDHWQLCHHNNRMFYKCVEEENVCLFSSSSFIETKTHLKEHMFELGFSLKCSVCKKFVEKFRMPEHMKAHNTVAGNFKCEECGKKFLFIKSLKQHSTIHGKNERKFICSFCPRAFFKNGALRAHVNTVHRKIWEYSCSLCDKRFQYPSSLKNHISSFHEQQQFSCEKCDATFGTKKTLKSHIDNVHNGVYKFNCDVESCTGKFNRKHLFIAHMNGHQGLRPFTCSTCGKGFGNQEVLRRHEELHLPSEERDKFPCKICRAVLSSSGSLCNHKKLIHKLELES